MSKIFTTISTRYRPGLSSLLLVGGCEHGLLLERGPCAGEEGDHQLRLLVHHVGGQELPEVLLQLILPSVQKQSESIFLLEMIIRGYLTFYTKRYIVEDIIQYI